MAPNRIAIIAPKRAALKGQVTSLCTAIIQGKIDATNAKLRLKRVTDLFHKYEELYDELALIDDQNEGLTQMVEIQDHFYDVAARIESMPIPGGSQSNNTTAPPPIVNSTFIERQKLLKLPVAELPKFDGDHNNWLSFKNTFVSMVDSRADVNDLTKFLYLRSALKGPALNKIARYDASPENYKNAWGLLVDSYEKKRILFSKHYDAILDIAPLTTATPAGLSRIIDEVRQHLNMLESLQVRPDQGLIVRLLERSLPFDIRQKWEESLGLDVLPTLDQFCKFVNETSFRLCAVEQDAARNKEGSGQRRAPRKNPAPKARKLESGARVLVTSSSISCTYCEADHYTYRCPALAKLSIQQRWEAVKSKGLCTNCLRAHTGRCTSVHCRRCDRFHHTILHPDAQKPTTTRVAHPPKNTSGKGKSAGEKPTA